MKDIIIYRICPQCECRTHISSLTVTTGLGEKVTNKQCFFYPLTSVSCQWALSSSPVSGPSVPSPVSVGPRFPALCQWALGSQPCVSGPSVPALCHCQWTLSSSPVSVGPQFQPCQWALGSQPCQWALGSQPCQWTLGSQPCQWTLGSQPCQWALGSQPCQWALGSQPCQWALGSQPCVSGPSVPALCQWALGSQPCVSGPSVPALSVGPRFPALSVGPWFPALSVGPRFPALCQWALGSQPCVSGPSVPSPVSLQRVSEALEQHSFCGVHAGLSWVRVEQIEWMVLIKEVGSELEGCMEGSGQVEVQARPGMPSLPPPPPTPLETPHFTSLTSHDLSALTEMLDHDFLRFCSEGCVTLLVTGWSEVHGNMNFKY